MTYQELSDLVSYPAFQTHQVVKLFPSESYSSIRVQLCRLVAAERLVRLKRGLYLFTDRPVDEMSLASLIYSPSYVSLEKALNIYGLIPDIPSVVTSVTTTTPNVFSTSMGQFSYSCISKELFFGFKLLQDSHGPMKYKLAEPEKALLDWIYLRNIVDLDQYRVSLSLVNRSKLLKYASHFPQWVRKVVT